MLDEKHAYTLALYEARRTINGAWGYTPAPRKRWNDLREAAYLNHAGSPRGAERFLFLVSRVASLTWGLVYAGPLSHARIKEDLRRARISLSLRLRSRPDLQEPVDAYLRTVLR